MGRAVYNRAIPNIISNLLICAKRCTLCRCAAVPIACVLFGLVAAAWGADWSGPEQQLARKIFAVTGPVAVALVIENRSSLGRRDSEIIQNGLRGALQGLGIRFVQEEQSASKVDVSLSENPASYVWVAKIRQGGNDAAVVMVSAPRPESSMMPSPESVPLSLRKTSLWTQSDPILDIAVLEEGETPTRIAVLSSESLSVYRFQSGKWQQEQKLGIGHAQPWPRDLRGRLFPTKDRGLDVYLPGVICRSDAATTWTINCRATDDPWPLLPAGLSGSAATVFASATSTSVTIPALGAFFAPARNFFTGVLTPGIGGLTTVSKFFSAALFPRGNSLLGFFAGTDGHVHAVDGASDQLTKLNWGSDVTSVRTSCGAGWQVLATGSEEGSGDSVRAYEVPDRDPIAVTTATEFAGAITALWTEARGDTAIAVTRNRETGSYEAHRLAVSCSQ